MYQVSRHAEIVGGVKSKLASIKKAKHKRTLKLKCCEELDMTEHTLQNYLNCKHIKLDFALKIIDWFEPLGEIDLKEARLKDIL